MRILIAEDSVLLRAGLTRLLLDAGEDVIASVGDADALLTAVERHQPELCVVDVRMPPTNTDDGLRAALQLRARWPEIGILVLSQYVEERYATELLAGAGNGAAGGLGYLLKDRVADVADFLGAVRRVGEGGTALDPEVVSQLLARSRQRDPLAALSPREREVLGRMAEGLSNSAIAAALVVNENTVEKHVTNIRNVSADVRVRTSNGGIVLDQVSGQADVRSSNGSVRGDGLTGDRVVARSSNGGVALTFLDPPVAVEARSTNGSVEVVVPDDAEVYRLEVDTVNGGTDAGVRSDPASDRSIVAVTVNGSASVRYPTG